MKRAAIIIAVLGISVWGFAANGFGQSNDKPAGQSAPAGQGGQATAAGKRPPQAKTQAEFDAYKAAVALTDPAAQEKAANDFATKFPDSELRPLLYKAVMHGYQQANNGDKMMEMAQKVLSFDPDDPEALLGVAQVLAERTRDTDLDKDQKSGGGEKRCAARAGDGGYGCSELGVSAGATEMRSRGFCVRRRTRFWGRSISTQSVGGCGGESEEVD